MKQHNDPLDTFREEARELLRVLETSLLALEVNPGDAEMVDSAFRSLHTIKGSGNMFDLDELVSFAHTVESVFVLVRDGRIPVSADLVSLGLLARDHIGRLLDTPEPNSGLTRAGFELESSFLVYLPDEPVSLRVDSAATGSTLGTRPEDGPLESREPGDEHTWRILFRPRADFFRNGNNPLLLIQELTGLGHLLVMGFSDEVPDIRTINPEDCYLSWELLLSTRSDENTIRDVFIFVEGDAEIALTLVDSVEDADLSYKRLGEILLERGDITAEALAGAVNERTYLGQALVDRGFVSSERVRAALEEQRYVRNLRETRREAEPSSVIKVKTERLGALVNLVGEFVSMHANLNYLAHQKDDQDFTAVGEQMDRLIRDLRDLSIELHMVPVELLFGGFRRLVRDLSADLKKQVDLVFEGAETELDKNVIDLLKDPLLHIIRNSVDHGIETPAVRTTAGKPPTGTLKLTASYAGAYVIIRVSDDGAGMNVPRIREKAIAKGLLLEDHDYRDDEVLQCIFEPGFSTAELSTDVSGRGVGMNVVQRNIENLGGSVGVTAVQGQGSEICLRIPLTLAIVEGLLATVDRNYYLINLSYIEECLDFSSVNREKGQDFISFRGSLVPFIDLRRFFRSPPADVANQQLVIVAMDDRRIGLLVDQIHDTYQSVIKSLGKVYEKLEGVSGAIMLGNGTPALVLDVDRLVRLSAKDVE